jgi:hypothetical protein
VVHQYILRFYRYKCFGGEGSDRIGDFAGDTIHTLVSIKALEFFECNDYFPCIQDVYFHPNPFRKKRSKYPIVPYPYSGLHFFRFYPKFGVNMNLEKSGIQNSVSRCFLCGQMTKWDENYERMFLEKRIVIDEEEWNGLRMFKIFDLGSPIKLTTDIYLSKEGRDLLMKQGFSNVVCEEIGCIKKAGHGKILRHREIGKYPYWKPETYVEPPPTKRTRKSSTKKINPNK